MKKNKKTRITAIIILAIIIFFIFFLRLVQLQITNGAKYLEYSNKRTAYTVPVAAARGEILDRYGRPLAVNRAAYCINVNAAFWPKDKLSQNKLILNITNILKKNNEKWNDTLPLSSTAPYGFLPERENDISRLKADLRLNNYATSSNVFDALKLKYELESFSDEEARIIAGIRYEMEFKGFNSSTPYVFANDVSMDTVTIIRENSADLPGITVQVEPIREYVSGDLAPHVIGTVGPIYAEEYAKLKDEGYKLSDYIGKSGIEKAFEKYLNGISGESIIEKTADNKVTNIVIKKEPIPGNTILLTIDKKLQEIAQKSLADRIEYVKRIGKEGGGKDAKGGAVAAIDVRNGEILVLASHPTYNISTFQKDYYTLLNDPLNPLFNRALNGVYPPGSTFKPCVALSGLQTGTITPTTVITCNHIYTALGSSGRGFSCLGYHGNISLESAMAVSCNIFFYEVGRRTGIDNIYKYASQLGLGQPTGVELTESTGILAGPKYRSSLGKAWYPGDTVQAAIGQSDHLFTPLQLANYIATIANEGTRYKAHLVKSIKSYNFDKTVKDTEPEILNKVEAKNEYFKNVKAAMQRVNKTGSGRHTFASYSIPTGGKTGTAQVPNGSPNAIYVAFAPVENPEIAVAVLVEHGYQGGWISEVAKDIFDEYFKNKSAIKQPDQIGVLLP